MNISSTGFRKAPLAAIALAALLVGCGDDHQPTPRVGGFLTDASVPEPTPDAAVEGEADASRPPRPEPCDEGATRACGGDLCSEGTQRCELGMWTHCRGPAETCDGLDNDCDGQVDEDFRELGKGCIAENDICTEAGVMICSPDGLGVECSAQPAPPTDEICDGEDNDCDGIIDEGLVQACYNGPLGTVDHGLCAAGTSTCEMGVWGRCADAITPVDETCDGRDEDCDGEIDEGPDGGALGVQCYTGPETTLGVGRCMPGTRICGGPADVCQGEVTPVDEICNGMDDDCDGVVDEVPGHGEACLVGVGRCLREGVLRCNRFTGQLACSEGPGKAEVETCDGIDDDCDGETDEGLIGEPAAQQRGVCAGALKACHGAAGWGEPDYTALESYEAVEITCDGLDNDCDGVVDEGLVAPEANRNTGVCAGQVKTCDGSSGWVEPDHSKLEQFEPIEASCDGLDNDCDGIIDEVQRAPAAALNEGVCAGLDQVCWGPGGWREPDYRQLPEYEVIEASCDDQDNDCDGLVDEGACFDAAQLALWLDADTLSDQVGGPLFRWEDKAGGPAIAPGAASRPQVRLDEGTGRAVVQFDEGQRVPLGSPRTLGLDGDHTLFLVFRSQAGGAYHLASANGGHRALKLNDLDAGAGISWQGTPAGPRVAERAVGALSDGRFHVVGVTMDGGNGRLWVDGVAGREIRAGMQSPSEDILQLAGGPEGGLVGEVAEVIVFRGALSDDTRTELERYLGTRWGVPLIEFGDLAARVIGVQAEVTLAGAEARGYSLCHRSTYDQGDLSLDSVMAGCAGAEWMVACRPVGADRLSVAAEGDRMIIEAATAESVLHNLAAWYLKGVGAGAFGFAPAGAELALAPCDEAEGGERLCWPMVDGVIQAGGRCGRELAPGAGWERLIFSRGALPRSCAEVQGFDGVHWIDPDGAEGKPPVQTWCDMQTDGGGWTLVAHTAGAVLAGSLNDSAGVFDPINRQGAGHLDTTALAQITHEIAYGWSALPAAGNIDGQDYAVRHFLPSPDEMALDPAAGDPACGNAERWISVDVECLQGECGLPAQMYTGVTSLGVCGGDAYGLVAPAEAESLCDVDLGADLSQGLYLSIGPVGGCGGVTAAPGVVEVPGGFTVWMR